FGIPVVIAGVLYAKWLGSKIYQIPDESGLEWERPDQPKTMAEFIEMENEKDLPSLFKSVMPIFLPILLIFLNTLVTALGLNGVIFDYIKFLGAPTIAVGVGLIFAIYALAGRLSRSETAERMEEGIQSAGIILLVTGGGGALGNVLSVSGAGGYIADVIASTALPAVLLPFVIATLVRLVQGSGTVGMITAASISAPILNGLDVNMVLAALAATSGTFVFSYFNDSLFWVVNRMLGIKNVKEQILTWSVPTTILWLVSLVELLIATAIVG
ncbi:MAG TPA: GntP family permease, partial [Bacillales bacterium]|nr:GntP family permease [Bacillales bacterium]